MSFFVFEEENGMKKIERILAIIVLLLENEIVSTAQLAQRFDVAKRTIFRDIETIELAGFPIVAHAGRNGGFFLIPRLLKSSSAVLFSRCRAWDT